MRHTFVPDYTVRAITEVFYVKVKRSLYLAARRATLLKKSQKDPSQDQFDDEVEKVSPVLFFFTNIKRLFTFDETDCVPQSGTEVNQYPTFVRYDFPPNLHKLKFLIKIFITAALRIRVIFQIFNTKIDVFATFF